MARLPVSHDAAGVESTGAPSRYRWVVLAGLWLVYATFGATTVSLAPLVGAVTGEFGIGHAAMGLVFGAWQLMFILCAVPAGGLMDRIGVRLGLLIGAASVAASALLRSLAIDYWSLLAAVAVLGVGGPLISTGAPKVVARWFQGQERGFAMGVYITGPALGSVAALAATNGVLMPAFGDDWRAVLRLWSAMALAAGVAWLAIAAHPEARRREAGAGSSPSRQREVVATLARLPAVQMLLAMSVGIFLVNHALNNWLVEILRAKGLSPAAAGYWSTIPTLVGLAGSLTIPRLATPERRHLMLGGLFAAALAATLLLRADQGPLLVLGLALQGIARSSMTTVAMLALVETPGVGERHAATASGMFFSAAEIGGASGPLVLGLIHDASGGFGACLGFLSTVMLALMLAASRLGRIAEAGPRNEQAGVPP